MTVPINGTSVNIGTAATDWIRLYNSPARVQVCTSSNLTIHAGQGIVCGIFASSANGFFRIDDYNGQSGATARIFNDFLVTSGVRYDCFNARFLNGLHWQLVSGVGTATVVYKVL